MASGPRTGERLCDSGTDEQTVAQRKKRLRRVSFAEVEITSVHVFERDEDVETPPTDGGGGGGSAKSQTPESENEVLGFFRELADGNDDLEEPSFYGGDGEEEEDASGSKSFLQPMESPGSSLFGSATPNDVDNFFGPVSTDFIRPGCLSDSGESDDHNHEITMDSTAFSMHFRSLVRSESGDLRTPTDGFGEKTPSTVATPSNPGSLMKLTTAKKLELFPDPADKSGGACDTNAMSLVGEDAPSYDYGKLSPDLEAILGEGSKQFNQNDDVADKVLDRVGALDVSAERVTLGDGASAASHEDQTNGFHSPSRNERSPADIHIREPIQSVIPLAEVNTPDQLNQLECLKTCQEGTRNDDSLEDKRSNQCADKTYEERLLSVGLVPSLSVKQQEMFNHAAKSFSTLSYLTPSPKQPGAILAKECIKSSEIFSSVHKTSSRLKDRIEESKLLLSRINSSTPYSMSVSALSKDSKNVASTWTGVPVANLDEHFSVADIRGICEQNAGSVQNGLAGSVRCIGSSGGLENVTSADYEDSIPHMSPSRVFKENPAQSMPKTSEFSSPKIKPGHGSDAKSITLHDRVSSPPTKSGAQNFLSFEENSCSLPSPSKQQPVQLTNLATVEVVQDVDLIGDGASNGQTSGITDKLESWFTERRASFSSPLVINHVDGISQMELANGKDQQCEHANLGDVSECASYKQVPTGGNVLNSHQGTPNGNGLLTAPIQSQALMEGSPDVRGYINEPSRIKTPCKEALTESQTREEHMIRSPDAKSVGGQNSKRQVMVQNSKSPDLAQEVENCSVRKRKGVVHEDSPMSSRIKSDRIVSPCCNSGGLLKNKGDTAFQVSCSPVVASDVGGSDMFEKRNVEELKGDTDKTSMVRSSPDTNMTNVPNREARIAFSNGRKGTEMIGGDTTTKHWRDISLELSALTKGLLSPSVDALNTKSIDMLLDILDHQQKVTMRQMFLSQIQQKICDQASKKIHDRTAEMRNLICKLVFERARVQLLAVKQQKFLKRRQTLSIAVQESQMLKSAKVLCLPVPSLHGKDKMSSEKLVALRHEFAALEGNLSGLTQHFRSEYKIGTEASHSEMIGLINDQLKKRICCRRLYEGIQLYKVQDLTNKNGVVSIVLNYRDLFSQRLTITAARTPSLLLSTKLNERNIIKKFPNMDACAAFAYVLNAEATKKYVGSTSLAQATRISSSLLHNLLDVVQELQKARIESINLVDATFSSASVERLDLRLSFVNVNNYTKMNLMLDITCLKHGVYPSDITPHGMQVSGTKKTHLESLSAQASAAVDGLTVGYFRILRLCRCISQVMSQ